MTRPPFLRTLLAAALAGTAAVALAQQPAPKATPPASLDAEIERYTREARQFKLDADAFRDDLLAQAADFDVDIDPDSPSYAFIARDTKHERD